MSDTSTHAMMREAAMMDASSNHVWARKVRRLCVERDKLQAQVAALDMAELVEALEAARDYVYDASHGILRYRGKADISRMAGEDLVMIDAALAKIKEPQT